MKKILFLFTLVFYTVTSYAQMSYNYAEYGVGVVGSSIHGYTNLRKQYNDKAFSLEFLYNYSPYLPVAAEIQMGTLSGGGNTVEEDKSTRRYENNYKAFILHGDVHLGTMIDYSYSGFLNFVKNFYIGTGVGVISNKVDVNRYSLIEPTYRFPGRDNGMDLIIPLRFGYEIKFFNRFDEPSFAIDLGYYHNVDLGEGLDGYNDPSSKFKNFAPDQYRQIAIGLKYNFGNITSYNKAIRR